MPDRQHNMEGNLGQKYFLAICNCALEMDLENEYYFNIALELMNSLLILRKTEYIVYSLKSKNNSNPNILKLALQINPQTILFFTFFKVSSKSEITDFYLNITLQISEFIIHQLPFKCKSREDIEKLSSLLKHYELVDKCLINITKVWAAESFLIHSLDLNQSNSY